MIKETRLVKQFLLHFKELYEKRVGEKFHPRHLILLFQDKLNNNQLNWIAYHHWFDTLQYSACTSHNLFEALLENAIHVLIEEEEIRKSSMLSKKDEKKLMKALTLLRDIKINYKKGKNK